MVADRSAWRASDVVAYAGLRDAAGTAIAMLFRLADEGSLSSAQAIGEAADIRRELFDVDASDRVAIETVLRALEQRLAELADQRA